MRRSNGRWCSARCSTSLSVCSAIWRSLGIRSKAIFWSTCHTVSFRWWPNLAFFSRSCSVCHSACFHAGRAYIRWCTARPPPVCSTRWPSPTVTYRTIDGFSWPYYWSWSLFAFRSSCLISSGFWASSARPPAQPFALSCHRCSSLTYHTRTPANGCWRSLCSAPVFCCCLFRRSPWSA